MNILESNCYEKLLPLAASELADSIGGGAGISPRLKNGSISKRAAKVGVGDRVDVGGGHPVRVLVVVHVGGDHPVGVDHRVRRRVVVDVLDGNPCVWRPGDSSF